MKKVLMVAYHYPPFGGGTGIERTLKFSRYLPEFGWQPIVLTVSPRAYPRQEQRSIPAGVLTARAFALDTARHLSFRGAYPQWMAVPDRWMTWWPGGVGLGASLIRRHRPDAIWSTYPVATAHLIGLTLQRWSGIPWIADFRDPLVQKDPITGEEYPHQPVVRKACSWIETKIVKYSRRIVFTTAGALSMYASRFPGAAESQMSVIPNGYDEEDFAAAERDVQVRPSCGKPLVLVHSGLLYPSERDPMAFFHALSGLRRAGRISPSTIKVILRATGHDDHYRTPLRELGIDDIVSLEPPISHSSAIAEMLQAHGLLIFQASNCNQQIPAKVYECLRAGRPIFAMTDPVGDTAALLRSAGVRTIVPLNSRTEIAEGLASFLSELSTSQTPTPPRAAGYSRKDRTQQLAAVLNSACAE